MNNKELGFSTKAIHSKTGKKDVHGAIKYPIYDGVAYAFEKAEDLEEAFSGRKLAHVYSRITNPTVEAFERKITVLENGLATIAVSSGMAAITNVFMSLLEKGNNIVSAKSIFGGTVSLMQNTLEPFGIETRFVDIDDKEQIIRAIDSNTKIIFFETIANPSMTVPDVQALSEVAENYNIVLVCDSTVTTPYLFKAKDFGVNIVIHSTTKFISGGATSIGGVIVDLGNFDWSNIHSLKKYHNFKEFAFIARLRKEVYRDLGSCLSPHNAYLQNLGLETLALRMKCSSNNALTVAEHLESSRFVNNVNYPGLATSSYHEIAKKQFEGLYGAILTFELQDKQSAFKFLNKLSLIKNATNLGDNTSLAIHPASTIFAEFDETERRSMGVTEGLIRLSLGIEDVKDIINDIDSALSS